MDASTNQNQLEIELANAFKNLGFDNAIRISGKSNPDGYAEAYLSGSDQGIAQSYKITLEAKSKELLGAKVSAKGVGISGISRHRKNRGADYAIVVGPDFPTTKGEASALAQEITEDRNKNPGKGITLIRINDMARLVRLVPAKRIGLERLRELFKNCSTPEQSKEWIDKLAKEKMQKPPYKALLDTVASEQHEVPNAPVEYASIVTSLRTVKNIILTKSEVIGLCQALSRMAGGYVFVHPATVEITQRPDKILESISSTLKLYPEDEQKTIPSPL